MRSSPTPSNQFGKKTLGCHVPGFQPGHGSDLAQLTMMPSRKQKSRFFVPSNARRSGEAGVEISCKAGLISHKNGFGERRIQFGLPPRLLVAHWDHEPARRSAAVSAAGSGGVSPPVRETGTGTVPEPAGGTPALRGSWRAATSKIGCTLGTMNRAIGAPACSRLTAHEYQFVFRVEAWARTL